MSTAKKAQAAMKTIRFGVELEYTSTSQRSMARAIHRVVGGQIQGWAENEVRGPDGRVWKAVYDGSIAGDGAEFVSPILTWEDISTLQEIVRSIRRSGARVHTSCGMHVHVDGAALNFPRTTDNVRKLVNLTHKFEDYIFRMADVVERLPRSMGGEADANGGRGWCHPLSAEFVAKLKKGMGERALNVANYGYYNEYPRHYDESRYHGLNLHALWDKGTVEFRYFKASTHAGKVRANVMLCLALTAWAIVSDRTSAKKKPYRDETAKYDARVILTKLGLNGDEHKNVRMHLTKHLNGCSAYQGGRPAASTTDSGAE
jgi:hypothetical protein